MTQPRQYTSYDQEYKNLKAAAAMLEAFSPNGYRYVVEDCYFDFGQNWMQTTIICHNPEEFGMLSSWQVVNPRQWEKVVEAQSLEEILEAVRNIQNGDYFRDKAA